MQGFIKLHRKICNWEWYQDANTFRLFVHLLLNANHKEKSWQGKTINRGQLVVGSEALSAQLGLSRQQIRTSLGKLKSTNEITTRATNKFTLVTLINYSSYQTRDDLPTNKTTNNPTNEQPTNNQQVTTNKNVKNDKNEEEVKETNSDFESLWAAYGRKGNKKTSLQKFEKLKQSDIDLIKIHLPEYVKSTPTIQFRKDFQTYINQECWNDEILAPTTPQDKHSGFKDRDYSKGATDMEKLSWAN